MPRIKRIEAKERPSYLSQDGTILSTDFFKLQPKQTELLQMRTRDGIPYIMTVAP